jgi:hypothetical protein
LTDWLNVSFPLYLEEENLGAFFERFGLVTGGLFGGVTDRERGLHGWQRSFAFDRGGVMFACGGQRNTAFLSIPGEGCAFVSDWRPLAEWLRDELRGRITRRDGAVDVGAASRIRTIKTQDDITYDRLKHVAGIAYGALVNVMLLRERSAERVVELLRREGVPRRLAFSDDYLRTQGDADEL